MIKVVGYFFLWMSFSAHGLVPVEGIIMGEAKESIQTDPLKMIFSDIYDKGQFGANKKVKLYHSTYRGGENLKESCSYLGAPEYSTPWEEIQAKRSVTATLQYIGLDTTIKAIGAYAKKLEMKEEDYNRLTSNIVSNYCSKNVTVFSLKTIEKSLQYYFKNPENQILPSVENLPFAPGSMKRISEQSNARSREFDHVLSNFRAFCSWGGDVDDYRMLTPYLNNSFIMAFIAKNMSGLQDTLDEKERKVKTITSPDTVQVVCSDLICRKEAPDVFKEKYPLSVGSTGILTDISKLYCHHFRFQDAPVKTIPQVKQWLKTQELEDSIFETSQFIALMTGIPDFTNGVETYREIPALAKSSIDERWTIWSTNSLNFFSQDLLFEESFKIKVEPRRDIADLASHGFEVDLSVTLGEFDRLLKDTDKLDLSFDLNLSKNYLRAIRTKWALLEEEVDIEGQKNYRDEVARYLDLQLKQKEKLLSQKMWNESFAKIIAEELLQQTKYYRGSLFTSYKDEVIKVPVKFSYGPFALSYLSYRAGLRP